MRSIVRAASLALLATTAVAATLPAQGTTPPVKLAYIDSRVLLQQAPGREEAAAQWQKEVGTYQAQMQQMSDSLQKMQAAYQKVQATLSPTARAGREKAIAQTQQQFEEKAQQLQEQAQQRQAALMQPIMERVNQVINQLRAERGYAIVFDAGSQGMPIVAADTTLDITQDVLARMKTAGATPTQSKPSVGAPLPAPAGVGRPPR